MGKRRRHRSAVTQQANPARLEPGVRPARAPRGPARYPCLVGKGKGRHRWLFLSELSTAARHSLQKKQDRKKASRCKTRAESTSNGKDEQEKREGDMLARPSGDKVLGSSTGTPHRLHAWMCRAVPLTAHPINRQTDHTARFWTSAGTAFWAHWGAARFSSAAGVQVTDSAPVTPGWGGLTCQPLSAVR